ncbi:MAG: hypothetical protein WCF85_21885, partial [Rhodospirillaceae bacterium]
WFGPMPMKAAQRLPGACGPHAALTRHRMNVDNHAMALIGLGLVAATLSASLRRNSLHTKR